MNWKTFLLLLAIFVNSINGRPGIRTPPARILRENSDDPLIQNLPSDPSIPDITVETVTNEDTVSSSSSSASASASPSEITPILTNRRIFTSANQNVRQNSDKVDEIPATSRQDSAGGYNIGPTHMGVAVPLTAEDLEKEMNDSMDKMSSTPKEGISTWILLSGGSPTRGPSSTGNYSSYRTEGKIEKVAKPDDKVMVQTTKRTTVKPKKATTVAMKTTATTTLKTDTQADDESASEKKENLKQEKPAVSIGTMRRKKPSSDRRPDNSVKTNKKTVMSTTTSPSTSLAPESSSASTVTSTTAETTTFLILEPKDADFDMPQDRSPGPTTKKPKRPNKNNKTKKTGNKNNKNELEKKPNKTPPPKDKPLSTKIYNYLAREVMPTVGMGLVGLAVTAGLATYFLGPLTALRRSYEVADRKDDIYFYNNEEYGGSDGQSEEEVFGKVIAGMPANSPYRNNIKYTLYRPNQVHHKSPRPGHYDTKYLAHPVQYRYRNTAPPYHGPGPHPHYPKIKPHDSYPGQQFFRYNNDVNTMYRTNLQNTPNVEVSNSDSNNNINNIPPKSELEDDNKQSNSVDMPTIVTPQPPQDPVLNSSDQPLDENNVLRRRSQFVVGSVQAIDTATEENRIVSNQQPAIVESVPEHGPRRRRRRYLVENINNEISDHENEVDGVSIMKVQPTTSTTTPSTSTDGIKNEPDSGSSSTLTPSSTEETIKNTSTPQGGLPQTPTTSFLPQQNIFEILRSIFEMKVRMGLNFLQNTTEAFQRYLKAVEKRVDDSKIFTAKHKQVQ